MAHSKNMPKYGDKSGPLNFDLLMEKSLIPALSLTPAELKITFELDDLCERAARNKNKVDYISVISIFRLTKPNEFGSMTMRKR